MIALSSGIKIFTVHNLILSHNMRVADAQTDGQTELRLPRPRWHSALKHLQIAN